MAHKAKLFKKSADKPSQLEDHVAKELYELENSSSDWKNDLKDVYISNVKEIDYTSKDKKKSKPVYLVYVPYPCLKVIQKLHKKLVPELESRLKANLLVVAKRTIQSKWQKTHKSQKRPNSRTLTAVHDAILEDLLLPAGIIGRRIRHRVDGSTVSKIILDQNDKDLIEDKLDAIAYVYKKISTKEITFEFRPELTFYTTKKA
jgi:small subunit ribosomal protein S7e